MPIQYKVQLVKYGCKFKCGRKHDIIEQFTEEHEEKCWFNPENKTCKTCKYEKYYTDWDDFREWKVRECLVGNISDEEFDKLEYGYIGLRKTGNIRPKENCDKWESK